MTAPIVEKALQYGALGILSIIGFVLYWYERMQNKVCADHERKQAKRELRARIAHARTIENLAEAVEGVEKKLDGLTDLVTTHNDQARMARVREEERQRITNPHGIPIPELPEEVL